MIAYDNRNWLLILSRVRGTVLPRIAGRIALVVAIAVAATYVYEEHGRDYAIPVTVHTIVGVALGLLLVFRTDSSYSRYWEGRILLGGMVNACRDLARQGSAYLATDDARDGFCRYVPALYGSIRRHLRGEREMPELADSLTAEQRASLETSPAAPLVVAGWISDLLHREVAEGRLSEVRLRVIDANVTRMIDYWGGCERIVNTPIPFAYAHHIKGFLTLFCVTVPLALLDSMQWYTPVAAAVVAFALFGIDEIGVEIEDPFGYDPNDLPLDAIGSTIEASVAASIRTAA
jgi:putative membrane protein